MRTHPLHLRHCAAERHRLVLIEFPRKCVVRGCCAGAEQQGHDRRADCRIAHGNTSVLATEAASAPPILTEKSDTLQLLKMKSHRTGGTFSARQGYGRGTGPRLKCRGNLERDASYIPRRTRFRAAC